MDLAAWMDAHGETILGLAERAGVVWRTVRDAREGKLLSVSKAKQIADAIGLDAEGRYVVDPSTMLDLSPDGHDQKDRTEAA